MQPLRQIVRSDDSIHFDITKYLQMEAKEKRLWLIGCITAWVAFLAAVSTFFYPGPGVILLVIINAWWVWETRK